MEEQVRILTPEERRALTTLLLEIEEARDPEWEVEMLRRAREARGGEGLVPQEEVEALHRRLTAEGR